MSFCYIPILKWKQGEQITLRELDSSDQSIMLPLIELLPFKQSPHLEFKETLKSGLTKTAEKLIKADFNVHPIAIDTLHMAPSHASQTKLMIATVVTLKKAGVNATPVIHPGMVLAEPAEFTRLADFDQVVLRIRTGSLLPAQVSNLITTLRNILGVGTTKINVLLDMFEMVGTVPATKAQG